MRGESGLEGARANAEPAFHGGHVEALVLGGSAQLGCIERRPQAKPCEKAGREGQDGEGEGKDEGAAVEGGGTGPGHGRVADGLRPRDNDGRPRCLRP